MNEEDLSAGEEVVQEDFAVGEEGIDDAAWAEALAVQETIDDAAV